MLVAALTLTAGACADGSGLRPMYGTLGGGPDVQHKLSQIQIASIPGRAGQRLRNELLFHTTGGGEASAPAYRLEIAIKQTTTSSLVLRNGDSVAQGLMLEASFQLVRIRDNSVVLTGRSQGRANFDRSANVFSNVRAADEAQQRAAKVIATDLRSRVTAVLASERA